VFPENVKAVIDKSCYGCHSENGRSDDAKDALRWDMLNEYDKEKLVSVLDEIIEVIEKEEMPPEKFLEKKPEVKPTEDEYAILLEWAELEAEKLFE
jgi:mono/diheme cytochrome c family protein